MFGLQLSTLTGKEKIYSSPKPLESKDLPEQYSFNDFIKSVKDQGRTNKCVPMAISQVVEWYWRTCGVEKASVDVDQLFSARTSDDGMSFLQAFDFMKSVGYRLNGVSELLKGFYMIPSRLLMQEHLVSSAPFLAALPVCDSQKTAFWRGPSVEGYHAVAVTGYSREGLIFVNSWGYSYGNGGFGLIPWSEISAVKEAWGMLL